MKTLQYNEKLTIS